MSPYEELGTLGGWGLTLKRSTFFDEGEDWKEKRFYLLSLSSCVSGFFFSSSGLKIKQINNYLWHQLKNMSKGKELYTLNTKFLFEKSGFHPKEAHLYHWIMTPSLVSLGHKTWWVFRLVQQEHLASPSPASWDCWAGSSRLYHQFSETNRKVHIIQKRVQM